MTCGENCPGVFLLAVSPPIKWSSRSSGTLRSARVPVRNRTSRRGPLYAPAWAMSGIWTGSCVTAIRPRMPSPRRIGVRRATAFTSSSRLLVARKWNSSVRSPYSKTEHASVPATWLAWETIVLSTVSRSSAELRAWLTSPRALSSSTERVS